MQWFCASLFMAVGFILIYCLSHEIIVRREAKRFEAFISRNGGRYKIRRVMISASYCHFGDRFMAIVFMKNGQKFIFRTVGACIKSV